MRNLTQRLVAPIFAGLVALAITAYGQGLWGLMVMANLETTPAIPWAAALMVPMLAVMVAFLGGFGWPRAGAAARRRLAPLRLVPREAFIWSLIAGGCGIVALAGLWIVLAGLVKTPPNVLPDAVHIPPVTLLATLAVSIVAAPVTEEIAFRGYAMGMLRKTFSPATAIVLSSALFALAHLTQGLYASKLTVYFVAGLAIAMVAYRTGSLIPAMIVHSATDLAFFTLVWPHDATRRLVSQGGADVWFWVHAGQAVVFGVLCVLANLQLVKVTRVEPAGRGNP
jgi:membrane protease YdiL (CAAX protease family)